ncbi:MAG: hypothetical protein RMI94_06805 [Bryobacterales bacterium]|nr:hypothetical protein [Bryobacteraceae bacterium]MDW8130241.1 hypothetical protein [Bryobacterales bacterium]
MEATLHALGELLIKAIPTFLLVLLLHFYLKTVFFAPLARVLDERRRATEGVRQRAEELLAKAAARAAEYEEAIRQARGEIYREQEAQRQRWQQERARAVAEARASARAMVEKARAEIESELEQARGLLQARSRQLAGEVVRIVAGRRAA